KRDWSSDVCASDLLGRAVPAAGPGTRRPAAPDRERGVPRGALGALAADRRRAATLERRPARGHGGGHAGQARGAGRLPHRDLRLLELEARAGSLLRVVSLLGLVDALGQVRGPGDAVEEAAGALGLRIAAHQRVELRS